MGFSFKTLFQSKKKNIFIHIPKCGGSTFVGLLKDSVKIDKASKKTATHLIAKIGNTEISHVDFTTQHRRFKNPEILRSGYDSSSANLFMLVRAPVARLLSEFNFQYHILNGKAGNPNAAIITRLSKKVNNFDQYISEKATQNYQCKFLLGRKVADPNPVTQEEYQRIIDAIDVHPIYCGVTEAYDNFLSLFQKISTIKLKAQAKRRKQTPKEYRKEVSASLRTKILKLNAFDVQLYKHIQSKISTDDKVETFQIEDQNEFII